MSTINRKKALDAAREIFARYGYRRTSMADVAAEAGLSRPALYQWFENKTALFKAMAEMMRDEALSEAESAWLAGADVQTGLFACVVAKDLPLVRLLHRSPHGAELLSVDVKLTAQIALQLEEGFAAILEKRIGVLAADGLVDLFAFGGAADFGRSVARLAGGLKREAGDEAEYIAEVKRLCTIVSAALRPDPGSA